MRFLAKTLWQHDKWIFVFFFLSIVFGGCVPYIGVLAPKYVLAGLLQKCGTAYWMGLVAVFGIGGALLGVLSALFTQQFKSHINAARNGCFGKLLTEKMLRMNYSLLEQPDVQEFCYRANFLFWSENSGMAGVFNSMSGLLTGAVTLLGLIAIVTGLHPLLPVLLGLLILCNMGLLSRARKCENKIRPDLSRTQREMNYLSETMHDIAAGKDIRLYSMGEYLTGWFRRTSQKNEAYTRKVRNQYAQADLGAAALAFVRDAALYGYLIYSVVQGSLAAEDFILYISAVMSFTSTFSQMINEFLTIRQFLDQTEDFQKVLALEEDPDVQTSADNGFSGLTLRGVSFSYPNGFGLKDLNFTIRRGEHIAVVGVNGSGKTTLVKLLLGLYQPNGGTYEIFDADGHPVPGCRYSLFSAVMQQIYQYAMTVGENVTFEEKGQEDESRLAEALLDSGLSEELAKLALGRDTMLRKDFEEQGVTLSGGQAQKLALARALYKNAPVLILDEPSAALDPIAEQKLYKSFDRLFDESTCIYISHRLSSVRFCDRILLMDAGRIIGDGPHEKLLQESELYRRLWEAQSQYYEQKGEKVHEQ